MEMSFIVSVRHKNHEAHAHQSNIFPSGLAGSLNILMICGVRKDARNQNVYPLSVDFEHIAN